MTKLLCNEHMKSILLHSKLFAKVAYTCRDWVKINAPGVVSDAEVFSPRAWLMLNASEASSTMEQCWCQPISLAVGALTMFCMVFCDLLHIRLAWKFTARWAAEHQVCNVQFAQ